MDGAALHGTSLGAMEDFDIQLDQHSPAIAVDGRGFLVAYLEESWDAIGTGQWNVFLATGALVPTVNDVDFALGERHLPLATTTAVEHAPRLVTRWESSASPSTSAGAAIWIRQMAAASPGFGRIHGISLSRYASSSLGPQPVGSQYCNANPNSVGSGGGRNSSWRRLIGSQSPTAQHLAACLDLPPLAFAMLATSRSAGNVNLPGGSQGRLCLGGAIGRYTAQLQQRNASGAAGFLIDPRALPLPGGNVAALPGETLFFEVWHRDSVGGASTSNFTNACRVQFSN